MRIAVEGKADLSARLLGPIQEVEPPRAVVISVGSGRKSIFGLLELCDRPLDGPAANLAREHLEVAPVVKHQHLAVRQIAGPDFHVECGSCCSWLRARQSLER